MYFEKCRNYVLQIVFNSLYPARALLLAVSCGSRSGHTGQMPPMEIEIAVAESDLLYTRRSFISQINSDNEVVVEPRVSGFLVARHYKKVCPCARVS